MNVLPTVTQEIVSQCKRQGFTISSNLASFFVRCQLLTAKKDPANNVELSTEHIERLVQQCVAALCHHDNPMLETFKLQASITHLQQDQINRYRNEKVQHKAKSHRLTEDLWPKKDPNEVFGDITLYILHESRQLQGGGMSSSTGGGLNELAQRETMAALESVFPKVHMDSFIAQREGDKLRQLDEIWRIVWGIRLFNKETGKGGAGIPDFLTETRVMLETSAKTALKYLVEFEHRSKDYAAVLCSPSLNVSDQERVRLQDEYHNRLQLCVYLRSLLETLGGLHKKLEVFEPTYQTMIEESKALVNSSEANPVPKSSIYPRFISLSEHWDNLCNLHRESGDAKSILELILGFSKSFSPQLRDKDAEAALKGAAEDRQPNKQLILQELATTSSVQYHGELPSATEVAGGAESLRLEFNGFCVVSLLDDGVLLDGRRDDKLSPGFLLLHANNAFYSFSTERALKSFAKDPFRYLSQNLMETVQRSPVLVFLLGLHPYLPKEIYVSGTRVITAGRTIERGDGATQTGQIDNYKDTHYHWNEWELRRLALQLAGLRNKRTKSTQSALSHFRRDNDAQAFLPKSAETQTMQDAAVQPPCVVKYIKGLRGSATSQLESVEKVFQH
jgi:hypothetical protein